ncbi:MAG TPA: orotidine-5'-phosphate decarboxylase [Anaerolineae bacterium]|nr:orotidine-5'-phosphate decarboxylase [Anaerolineae bacterium]
MTQPTSQPANQPTPKPFLQKLAQAQARNNSWVCVGLDVVVAQMPLPLAKVDDPMFPFARDIIDATKDLVSAYKPNLGFFLAEGAAGMIALERLVRYIPDDIPIILDAKSADIGSTAEQYARAAFEAFRADAVTVNPYLGEDGIAPFLKYADRCAIVLARTSNPSAGLLQSLPAGESTVDELIARKTVEWDERYPGACGLVVGATAPEALARMRSIAPALPFLIPGIGAQGGDLASAVAHGSTRSGIGPIINASRSILYASSKTDFAEAARAATLTLRDAINRLRQLAIW